jgi:hypothetical protein
MQGGWIANHVDAKPITSLKNSGKSLMLFLKHTSGNAKKQQRLQIPLRIHGNQSR